MVPATETSGELTEVPMDGAEITGNSSRQKNISFNSLVADTATMFLDCKGGATADVLREKWL